jgi:hypothetical protein
MRRWLSCGLALGSLTVFGCGVLPGNKRQTAPAPTAPAPSDAKLTAPAGRFTPPTDPCSAVAPATAQRFKLVRPEKNVLPGMDSDPSTGTLVEYQNLQCIWTFDNPAKGSNSRPNMWTLTVSYSVIDRNFPAALDVAKGIYQLRKDKSTSDANRRVTRTDTPAGLGDEASYSFAVKTTSLGRSGEAQLLIVSSNAAVSITYSGADLLVDPSKKVGFQLYTGEVKEDQLQPAVMGIAGEVMSLLG